MNKTALMKGVSLVAAVVLLGAGCTGSGSGSVETQQPSGSVEVDVGGDY